MRERHGVSLPGDWSLQDSPEGQRTRQARAVPLLTCGSHRAAQGGPARLAGCRRHKMPLHECTNCESGRIDGEASCRCEIQPISRMGHPGTQRAEDVSHPCQVESGLTAPTTRGRDRGLDQFSLVTPLTDVGGSLIATAGHISVMAGRGLFLSRQF
jgi:hypothetical protein